MLPVAILAGGVASRLRPVTEKIPKALVEVAGKPFVFHQLEWLRGEGARKVVLCVGYLGDQIREVVGHGQQFGLAVDYSFDGEPLLGTGGALRKAMHKLGKDFFVLFGDSYLTCSLQDVERAYFKAGRSALMTVFKNDGKWDRSNVIFRDGRILRYDKKKSSSEMQYIDYGLNVLPASVLLAPELPDAFDLGDVLTGLSERGELAGYEVNQRFYEIGSHDGLKETDEFFSRRRK
ncbi:MAG: nucleotidyl transferase [Betaproteobacteria bacterium]|nr:MAG: nucleotidyl transferase [Betaproteobacteria bacterium]